MHPKHSARRTFSITKFGTPFLLSLTFSSNLFETCTSKLVPACPGAAQGPQQLSPALPPSCKLACTALRIWEPSSWPFRDLVAIRNQSRAVLILNKSSRSSLAARLKFPFSQNKDQLSWCTTFLVFFLPQRSQATRFRWHQPAPFDKQQTWAIDNVYIGDGCIDMCSGHGKCTQDNCV